MYVYIERERDVYIYIYIYIISTDRQMAWVSRGLYHPYLVQIKFC